MTQTVMITGANRGLGLEFVRQYLADGSQVVACCRQPAQAKELTELLREAAGRLAIHRLDVSDHGQIEALADQCAHIAIDVLINNAGIYGSMQRQHLGSMDYETWKQLFWVNSIAPFKVIDAFRPHLARGQRKLVAVISSKMGSMDDNTSGGAYAYRSSKAAANAVMKSMAHDLPDTICLTLHPGWVQTDMGGPNALIDASTSICGMKAILDGATLQDSGKFFAFDGKEVPW